MKAWKLKSVLKDIPDEADVKVELWDSDDAPREGWADNVRHERTVMVEEVPEDHPDNFPEDHNFVIIASVN